MTLDRELELLRKIESLVNETPTWQPIETAPRDGRVFLAWDTGRTAGYVADQRYATAAWTGKVFQDNRTGAALMQATHWMPLPSAPAHLAQGSGE